MLHFQRQARAWPLCDYSYEAKSFYKETIMFSLRSKTKPTEPKVNHEQTEFRFSNSIQVAMDFYYKALHGQLPRNQQKKINCSTKTKPSVHHISATPISTDQATIESARSVWFYFSEWEGGGSPYVVVELRQSLVKGALWRVVSFEYPQRDGRWTAVFETHYHFGLKTKSYDSSSCY